MMNEPPSIFLTNREFAALPEYSCTLPDSYKRPIAEGGRPWKRRVPYYGPLNFWLRGEYIQDPQPGMLGIKWERIEIGDDYQI